MKENQLRINVTKFLNYKSCFYVKLNDRVRKTNYIKSKECLFYDKKILTELKMIRDKLINNVLKNIFNETIF